MSLGIEDAGESAYQWLRDNDLEENYTSKLSEQDWVLGKWDIPFSLSIVIGENSEVFDSSG